MDENTLEFEKAQNVPANKRHWRLLTNKEFIIGEMIPEGGQTLTIKSATKEKIQSERGEEEKAIISFEETKLKAVFNVTNLRKTAEVLDTPFPSEWVGKKITLISETHKYFGKVQKCLRIK